MAMSAEEFDAAMNSIQNTDYSAMFGGGSAGPDATTVEEKRATLFDKSIKKEQEIYGTTTPTTLQKIVDGDTYIGGDGQSRRQTGYDSYETDHGEYNKSPKEQIRLSRQRQRLAAERGVDASEITNEDVFAEGNKERLENLYNMVKSPGDDPWTPGESDGTEFLGDDQNPLNIPINEQLDPTQKAGVRLVGSAFNPNTKKNVNEQMLTDNNALIFDQGAKRPNVQKMAIQNAAIAQQEKGSALNNQERAAFGMAQPGSKESFRDAADARMLESPAAGGSNRIWNNIKSAGATAANMVSSAGDTITELGVAAGGGLGIWDPKGEGAQFADKLFDTNKEEWDERLGVDSQFIDAANKDLEDKVAEGDYLGAVGSVLENGDVHLTQSLPEMGAMAFKIPGLLVVVNDKVKGITNDFIEKNGREPTAEETAGMWVTTMAVMVPEKFLLVGPLKSIFNGVKKAQKAGSKTKSLATRVSDKVDNLLPKTKTIGGSAKKVGGTVLGEAAQEMADAQNEKMWVDGEWLTPDEAITAGIAGGVMGGAISSAAETKSVAKNTKESLRRDKVKKSVRDMSKEDYELKKEGLNEDKREREANIENVAKAQKEVNDAESFDDLDKSTNRDIKDRLKKETDIAKKEVRESKDFKDKVEKKVSELSPFARKRLAVNKLGLEEDATDAEIIAGLNGLDSVPGSIMQENEFNAIVKTKLDEGLGDLKSQMTKDLENVAVNQEAQKRSSQDAIAEMEKYRKSETKKGNVSKQKSGDIDTKNLKDKEYTGGFLKKSASLAVDAIKSLTGVGSTNKGKIAAELNKYDNASIEKAIKDSGENSDVAIQGVKILKRRDKAEEFASTGADISDLSFARGDGSKARNFQKLKNLVSQKEISNQAQKDYINKAIGEMEKRGEINKTQATLMRNRLKKSKVGTDDTVDFKDRKLFRDSNDVQQDIDGLNKRKKRLENDGGSGANDGKIGTINDQIASLERELKGELAYEKDNNITPEPAVKPVEKEEKRAEPDSEPETKTDKEPDPEAETADPEVDKYTVDEEDMNTNKSEAESDYTDEESSQSDPVNEGYEEGGTFDSQSFLDKNKC